MLYKNFEINGQKFQLAVNQSGKGAPQTSTAGSVGVLYMNENNGDLYKCTAVSGGTYTWKPLKEGSSGGPAGPLADLTFTGAVSEKYDGTKPVTVEIPSASGNSGGGSKLVLKKTIEVQDGVADVQEDFTDLGIEYPVIYIELPNPIKKLGIGLSRTDGKFTYFRYNKDTDKPYVFIIELSESPVPDYKFLTFKSAARAGEIEFGWPEGTYGEEMTQQFGGKWTKKVIRLRGDGANFGGAKIYIMARE